MKFMKKRILNQLINIDKVAYKEVNFKSKLLEWTQKNRVRMDFRQISQSKDETGSPVFEYVVVIEGIDGCKGKGYSKKESQQLASRDTLQRLRREPQFIDAIFAVKADRTKMEEEPVMAAPDLEKLENPDFIVEQEKPIEKKQPQKAEEHVATEPRQTVLDDLTLDDISATPREKTREEIIAEAEEAAFLDV
jgi:ribonuclease-3